MAQTGPEGSQWHGGIRILAGGLNTCKVMCKENAVTSRPTLQLTRSPLILALAQVRFSAVLKMDSYVPDIQEALRQQGFPLFKANETQQILLGPEPRIGKAIRWIFSSEDARTSVVLTNDFLALETNTYDHFEGFAARLQVALDVVKEIVKVALAERIGLRYVNLIQPREGEPLAKYLHAGLLGVPVDDLGVSNGLTRLETRGQTDHGQLVLRVLQSRGSGVLPPDIEATDIEFKIEHNPEQVVTLLDIDHFVADRCPFNSKELLNTASALHEVVERAFLAGTTREGRVVWGSNEAP